MQAPEDRAAYLPRAPTRPLLTSAACAVKAVVARLHLHGGLCRRRRYAIEWGGHARRRRHTRLRSHAHTGTVAVPLVLAVPLGMLATRVSTRVLREARLGSQPLAGPSPSPCVGSGGHQHSGFVVCTRATTAHDSTISRQAVWRTTQTSAVSSDRQPCAYAHARMCVLYHHCHCAHACQRLYARECRGRQCLFRTVVAAVRGCGDGLGWAEYPQQYRIVCGTTATCRQTTPDASAILWCANYHHQHRHHCCCCCCCS